MSPSAMAGMFPHFMNSVATWPPPSPLSEKTIISSVDLQKNAGKVNPWPRMSLFLRRVASGAKFAAGGTNRTFDGYGLSSLASE